LNSVYRATEDWTARPPEVLFPNERKAKGNVFKLGEVVRDKRKNWRKLAARVVFDPVRRLVGGKPKGYMQAHYLGGDGGKGRTQLGPPIVPP